MKMELSNGELSVMEILWSGECLDENGEIQALELYKILNKKYSFGKTSCYTFFGRLVEKGAISRRYPKYTIKPIVSREEALKEQQEKAIESEKKISKDELKEIRDLIDSFDTEER